MKSNRNYEFKVRVTKEELDHVTNNAFQCKLSRESYVRMLINGFTPRASPSRELVQYINLIRNIANNINQIAYVANCTNTIDKESFIANYNELTLYLQEVMEAMTNVKEVQ